MSTLKLATTLVAIRAAANATAPLFLKADGEYPLTVTGLGPVWKSGPTFETSIGAVPIAELCSTTNASVVSALFPGGDTSDTVTLGIAITVTISKGRIVSAKAKDSKPPFEAWLVSQSQEYRENTTLKGQQEAYDKL